MLACGEQAIRRAARVRQLQPFLYLVQSEGRGLNQQKVSKVAIAMGVPGSQSTVSNVLRRQHL